MLFSLGWQFYRFTLYNTLLELIRDFIPLPWLVFIRQKVKLIARLWFELSYNDVGHEHVTHYFTSIPRVSVCTRVFTNVYVYFGTYLLRE